MTKEQEEMRFDELLAQLEEYGFAQSKEMFAGDIYERGFDNGSHAEIYVDEGTLTINDLELYDESGELIGFTHEIASIADVVRSLDVWGYNIDEQ